MSISNYYSTDDNEFQPEADMGNQELGNLNMHELDAPAKPSRIFKNVLKTFAALALIGVVSGAMLLVSSKHGNTSSSEPAAQTSLNAVLHEHGM
jgi:hypothetical protein